MNTITQKNLKKKEFILLTLLHHGPSKEVRAGTKDVIAVKHMLLNKATCPSVVPPIVNWALQHQSLLCYTAEEEDAGYPSETC